MARLMCSRSDVCSPARPSFSSMFKRNRSEEGALETRRLDTVQQQDVAYGVATCAGRRPYMEDYHMVVRKESSLNRLQGHNFFLVADGHGGAKVAEFVSQNLYDCLTSELEQAEGPELDTPAVEKALSCAFVSVDESLPTTYSSECGSTALTALVSRSHITVANSGDSRAVLSRGGIAVALTQDHSPDRTDEQDRVRAAGGLILNQNGIRVMGVLAMTRAIGDKSLREFGVIPDPDVISVPISSEDDFLILASDGLWDVVSNQEAVNIARLCKRKAILRGADHGVAARVAARVLMRTASQRGSSDNITVIVVDLSHTEEYKPLHSEPAPVRPSVISGFRVGTNSSSSSCSQAANYQGMHQAQSMRVVSSGTIFGSNECATLAAGNAKRMRIAFQPKAAAGKQQENLQKFISSYKQWPDAHKSAARVISA